MINIYLAHLPIYIFFMGMIIVATGSELVAVLFLVGVIIAIFSVINSLTQEHCVQYYVLSIYHGFVSSYHSYHCCVNTLSPRAEKSQDTNYAEVGNAHSITRKLTNIFYLIPHIHRSSRPS